MHGEFCWNELMTRDVAAARKFYAEVFGWNYEITATGADGAYVVAVHEGRPVAGIFDISAPSFDGMPPHWFAYIATDDVDAAVADAIAAGAKPIREVFSVPEVGRIGLLIDPTGAAIGFYQPAEISGCCGGECGCHG